ncbi:MAG: PIN domain-containing protein [Nanoarchaeota archaeon]
MTDNRLIDSSVWLAYLFNSQYKEIIESEGIYLLSVLSLFEIKRKLVKSKLEETKIAKSVDFIKKQSLIIPITSEIAEMSVEISLMHNLATIDSLIYSTSIINKSILLTLDNDFRGLKDVRILGK